MKGLARDEGVATVAALGLVSVLLVAAFVAVVVGQQASARGQLSSAADIAALAAAQSLDDPCQAAAESAAANAVTLAECRVEGLDVVLTVTRPAAPLTVRLLGWLGHAARDLVAVARAGPPD